MRFVLPRLDVRYSARRAAAAVAALGPVVFALAGCGPGPAPQGFGQTAHAGDIVIAATDLGSGELAFEYDFDQPVIVSASSNDGTSVLYSASVPGFDLAVRNDPADSFFVLADGVQITLQIVDIEPGVRLDVGNTVLDAVGASAVLGTTPEVHVHPEWQLVLPEGTPPAEYNVSFKLTTDSALYGESAVYSATIAVDE